MEGAVGRSSGISGHGDAGCPLCPPLTPGLTPVSQASPAPVGASVRLPVLVNLPSHAHTRDAGVFLCFVLEWEMTARSVLEQTSHNVPFGRLKEGQCDRQGALRVGASAWPALTPPPGHLQPGRTAVSEDGAGADALCAQGCPQASSAPSGTAEPGHSRPATRPHLPQTEALAQPGPGCLRGRGEPCPRLTRERKLMFPCDSKTQK